MAAMMMLAVLGGPGCARATNPQCIDDGESLEAEPGDDLGGFTMLELAKGRSTVTELVDSLGHSSALAITTEVVGPVDGYREDVCFTSLWYSSPVVVGLRTADGRVDVELEGTLEYYEEEGSGGSVVVELVESYFADLAEVPGRVDLPRRIGATSTWKGVEFDVSGEGGMGRIDWVIATGQRVRAGWFEVPWMDSAETE